MAGKLFGPDTMNAPWGLESRLKLAKLACQFFDFSRIADNHKAIGKAVSGAQSLHPLTAEDFIKFLELSRAFSKTPNGFLVMNFLQQMVSKGLLVYAGQGRSPVLGLKDHYLYIEMGLEARRGSFRLVRLLGPEFLYKLCAPSLVHITGTNENGDVVGGTGFVVNTSYVLTCRHVVSDMKLKHRQTIQGREYTVNAKSVHQHPSIDVAVIRVDGPPLSPLKGALFQPPVVAKTVYTLGYPKLPMLREASVTMQHGAVTNQSVTSLEGDNLFLYSAISRPGNSGGPVMSEDGYVVGLSIVDSAGKYVENDAFSPHYAGIPAQVVVKAVKDLGLGIELVFEGYE